jgi:hypothetical protein
MKAAQAEELIREVRQLREEVRRLGAVAIPRPYPVYIPQHIPWYQQPYQQVPWYGTINGGTTNDSVRVGQQGYGGFTYTANAQIAAGGQS